MYVYHCTKQIWFSIRLELWEFGRQLDNGLLNLLDGGAVFAELWALSCGHGYAWSFKKSWICRLIFYHLSHFSRESLNISYLRQNPVPYLAWPLIRRKGALGKNETIAIYSKKYQFFCLYSREIIFQGVNISCFFTSGFLSSWFC